MIVRTIFGLLIVMTGYSCSQQTPKSVQQIDNGSSQHLESKTGLTIENGINRGTSYTNSLGTDFNLRYIPITITNDSTTPIHFEIAFSKEYEYPVAYGDQKFKIFLLPKVFTLDQVTLTTDHEILIDSIQNRFRHYTENGLDTPYFLNETLEPDEKCVVVIGTQYPRPTNCGVVPNALFAQRDSDNFQACDSRMPAQPVGGNQDKSTNPQLALGLKLDFYPGSAPEKCTLIPCGQIYYPER